MKNSSLRPCPICKKHMFIVGSTQSGKKIGSCGHTFKFKRTRSQKIMDRQYITTIWGLEKK